MDKKIIAVLAAVVIVVIAAVAVFAIGDDDSDKKSPESDGLTSVDFAATSGTINAEDLSSALDTISNSKEQKQLNITIPESVTADHSTNVSIDAKAVKKLAESKGTLFIETSSGSISMDNAALTSLKTEDLVITIGVKDDAAAISDALGSKLTEASTIINASIVSGTEIHEVTGNIQVSVPYTLKAGENPDAVEIWYKPASGNMEEYDATYSNGVVSFTVPHLSVFYIAFMTVDEAENDYVKVDFKFNNEVRLALFGNANGDDYLDESDYELLEKIVGREVIFNPKTSCFADTNADGKINADDLAILRKILDKEECEMKYWDAASKIASINYPLSGNAAVYHVYPLDAMIILGLYDQVVGMSNQGYQNSIGKDPSRYPGINDKIKNIGTPHEDPEALLATNADYYVIPWSYDNSKIESAIKARECNMQIVQLPMSKNGPAIVDQYGALLMLGYMTQTEDKAHEYLKFIDDIQDKINEAVANIEGSYTFITPFESSSASTGFKLDSPYNNGSMPGDVYTVSKLPMESVNIVVESGCPEVTTEWVYKVNPDVIVLIMFNDYTSSVSDCQEEFDAAAEKLKWTDAYKNKMIFGVNYYNIANYAGIPTLPLLASYIWPELFDSAEAMTQLQTYYETYTAYDSPVVADMGNAIVYKMA